MDLAAFLANLETIATAGRAKVLDDLGIVQADLPTAATEIKQGVDSAELMAQHFIDEITALLGPGSTVAAKPAT